MKITRRKFLGAVPVVAGAVLSLNSGIFGQKTRPGPVMPPIGVDTLSKLTWNSFYPHQSTYFDFTSGGEDVPLLLESIIDSSPRDAALQKTSKGECFILKFVGPRRLPLTQGTYDVNHDILGEFRLFITEGGHVRRKNYYFAVINRMVG